MSGTVLTVRAERSMRVVVDGAELTSWTTAEVGRDLADIAGGYRIQFDDAARDASAGFADQTSASVVHEHMPVEIYVLGELVLRGHVEDLQTRVTPQEATGTFSGRDLVGDLVDCVANPLGPVEYRNVSLMSVAGSLVQPFGLSIDSDVDTGTPFTLVALDEGEPAMGSIEKLSRQRGVLVVSDGVGGVRLTKAGQQQAAGALTFPGNVISVESDVSVRDHYSDVFVKGQFQSVLRPAKAPLSASSAPVDTVAGNGLTTFTDHESAATLRYGHAVDPLVGRWRPRVWLSKTQSGGSAGTQNAGNPAVDPDASGSLRSQSVNASAYHATRRGRRKKRKASKPRTDADPWTLQDQAEWRMRSTRAHGRARIYTVQGFSVAGEIWRPNTRVSVKDLYNGLDGEYLIGAVTYVSDSQGDRTRISIVSLDAYDIEGEPSRSGKSFRRSSR
ncbi:MAG: phage baseplate assembly protein [Acetobacter sp.]|uniref:phage baseplate assembly protein n=1 Tax=Acetobacter sp. TaxID=440 RepID=UPI0039EB4854